MPGKNNKRPRHLDLRHIRLPVGGVVSILHRVTGLLLVVLLPFAMWLLQQSLTSVEGYARIAGLLHAWPLRLALFLATLALAHHFFAGVRHLLLDLDIGIDRAGGRRGAWAVFAALALTALFSAACLFL